MQIAGNFDFPGWSGLLQALQNDLYLGASPSGDVVVLAPASLRPDQDCVTSLGSGTHQWSALYSCSGAISQGLTVNGIPVSGTPQEQFVVYVGKHGDDNNNGRNVENAVFSFGRAVSLASGLVVNQDENTCVVCVDGGLYIEGQLDVPSGVVVSAPAITYSGMLSPYGGSQIRFNELYGDSSLGYAVYKPDADGVAIVDVDRLYADGVDGVTAEQPDSTLVFNANFVETRNNGGFAGSTLSAGTVIASANEVKAFGVDGFGVVNVNGTVHANIGHYYEVNPGTGALSTFLWHVGISNPQSHITVGSVQATTLYDVSSGSGFIYAHRLLGGNQIDAGGTVCLVETCAVDSLFETVSYLAPPVDARDVSGSILPETDCAYPLGSIAARFERVTGCSGVFDHLQPATSGGQIDVGGHLIPTEDDVYDLGTENHRWAAIHAASGQFGGVEVLSGGDIDIVNGDINCPIGSVNSQTMTAVLGAVTTMLNTFLLTITRPEFSLVASLNTGSGLALRNENIWYDHLARSSEAASVQSLALAMNNVSSRTLPVPLPDANSCALADHFTMVTLSATSSPSSWRVDLRRTQSDGTIENGGIVASGFFNWADAADSAQKTYGRWETSGNVPVEFEPGSCYDVIIHNNGSGTAITAPSVRLALGFKINAPNLGRGA